MSLVFALKVLSDISFCLTFLSFILSMLGGDSLFITVPVFTVALLGCGALLNKGTLRFLPLVLLASAFLLVPADVKNYTALALPCTYIIFSVAKSGTFASRFDYSRVFSLFLRLFIPFLIVTAIAFRAHLENGAVQFGVIFLLCAVLLMRMLRHDEEVLAQKKFGVMNTISVVAALGLIFVLSSPAFLSIAKTVIGAIYGYVLAPVVIAVITAIINLLWPLISRLDLSRMMKGMAELEPGEPVMPDEFVETLGVDAGIFAMIVKVLSITIVVLLCALIIYRVFKFLYSARGRASGSGISERRSVYIPPLRPHINVGGGSGQQVREIYRRFLRMCSREGIVLEPYMTSADVEALSADKCNKPADAAEIRNIYIDVRYGEKPAEKGNIKHLRELCRSFFDKKDT